MAVVVPPECYPSAAKAVTLAMAFPKALIRTSCVAHFTYFAENLNTVFDLNVSPGFRIVLGKSG
jgi:hypothetical protein